MNWFQMLTTCHIIFPYAASGSHDMSAGLSKNRDSKEQDGRLNIFYNSVFIFFNKSSFFEVYLTIKNYIFLMCTIWWFDICIPCEIITTFRLMSISILFLSHTRGGHTLPFPQCRKEPHKGLYSKWGLEGLFLKQVTSTGNFLNLIKFIYMKKKKT